MMTNSEAEEKILNIAHSLGLSSSDARAVTREFLREARQRLKEVPSPDHLIRENGSEIHVQCEGGKEKAQSLLERHLEKTSVPGTWKVEEKALRRGEECFIARKEDPKSSPSGDKEEEPKGFIEAFKSLTPEEQKSFLEEHNK